MKHDYNFDFGLETSDAVFPTSTRDIQIVGSMPGCTLPIDDHKAVIRTDKDGTNPRGVGVVGKDYKLLKHGDLFRSIEKSITGTMERDLVEGVKVSTDLSFDGAWVQREYIFPQFAKELETSNGFKTNIGFRIIGWNSLDGSSSVGCASGIYDFFCQNGVIIGAMADLSKRRHTKNLEPDHFANQIVMGINTVQAEIDMLRRMATTPLDHDKVINLLERKFSARRAERLENRLKIEIEERGDNVFAFHSALTYFASHNSSEFGVRETGADNVAKALHMRGVEIAKIMPAVRAMAA